jgi:type VI protein secretion system component VasF
VPDPLRALRRSLTEQLRALRAVQPDQLPRAWLDLSVRRAGDDYSACPAD